MLVFVGFSSAGKQHKNVNVNLRDEPVAPGSALLVESGDAWRFCFKMRSGGDYGSEDLFRSPSAFPITRKIMRGHPVRLVAEQS